MEPDILYLQATKNIALSDFTLLSLSVLGPYLNEVQYETLTSITCCALKIAFVPNNNFFSCWLRLIFYLIFQLGLDKNSPVRLKSRGSW